MVSTTCHKDINRNIIQIHTYFSRSGENNVSYLYLTPSNYCWALLMVSFNFVYWQWRVMSSKQQFSKESRAQFNKPTSFLTYKLNWIFCRLQKARVPEPTYPQGKTATLNMWRKNQGDFVKKALRWLFQTSSIPSPPSHSPDWFLNLLEEKLFWRCCDGCRQAELFVREKRQKGRAHFSLLLIAYKFAVFT